MSGAARNEIKKKILAGSKLAIQKIIERKKRENACLVVSLKGKITKIPARSIRIKAAR